jgi:ABC-type sulfate/molybdate transport systems ATPase subunit
VGSAGIDVTARSGEVLLTARGVRVARGTREVIRGVDFELRAGEITVMLGPNGAGKSTLLDALAGLLPTTAGRIELNGRLALALQAPDLARRSVISNLQLALGWWGVPRGERTARAHRALQAMHAAHLHDRPARTLSGGERRRVHLARAVSLQSDILLLDEPFAGLDTATRAALLDDTGSALRSWAKSTLIVAHDRAEAWALADRVLVLIDGTLVADAPPQQLFTRPPTIEVARFLGYDGTQAEPDGGILLTRTHDIMLDPESSLRGRVVRAIPVEDGQRLELQLDHGRVYALIPLPGARAGDQLGVRITGGARFPGPAHNDHHDAPVPSDPPHSVIP